MLDDRKKTLLQADVLIVGAGVAGCTLAYLLARAGRKAIIVEKLRMAEKDKLCGGVINDRGRALMDAIFGPQVLDELGAAHLDGMHVLYRGYDTHVACGPFRSLPRAQIDAYLLDNALSAGAVLLERRTVAGIDEAARTAVPINLETGAEERISYGTLVAADGALSSVRALLTGRSPKTVASLEAQTEPLADGGRITQRVYPAIAGGCWHIPQGDAAVIGCLFFPEKSHEPVGDQRILLSAFADELGCSCGTLRGAPVPTGEDVCLKTPGGSFFAGDAAGLIEPSLGAGIHLALQSAYSIFRELAGIERYEDAMADEVARMKRSAEWVAGSYLRLGVAALRDSS